MSNKNETSRQSSFPDAPQTSKSPKGVPHAVSDSKLRRLGEPSFDIPLKDGGRVLSRRSSRRMSGSGNNLAPTGANRMRSYKSNTGKWVTREIACLEFLQGIPMKAEREIVSKGWRQLHGDVDTVDSERKEEEKVEILEPPSQPDAETALSTPSTPSQNIRRTGKWWEKWISGDTSSHMDFLSRQSRVEEEELEQPPDLGQTIQKDDTNKGNQSKPLIPDKIVVPGRRLHGDEATRVEIPHFDTSSLITRQRSVARMAHGIDNGNHSKSTAATPTASKKVRPPMLDGRIFFSAGESYPMQVFSLLRYEPRKEEAARRRQKLEARGGGGTKFFISPPRDWRGTSYRALLPTRKHRLHNNMGHDSILQFDRFASITFGAGEDPQNVEKSGEVLQSDGQLGGDHEADDEETVDSEEEDTYVVGLLDDPEMVQGKHRNVMMGDRAAGPIVSSTIQFVKPELLKADLNKQFRDRFDGWEPPKSQRQYIGAKVIDGVYTLMDPGADDPDEGLQEEKSVTTPRKRQGSLSSLPGTGEGKETIRMPPSLTLSKIRSLKQQVLKAALKARLEISTVALAFVYFERLCLDCRVDKTNRRLSFAACLLLALKMNEANVELVMTKADPDDSKKSSRLRSLIRPAKKSDKLFASVLEFFTQDWGLSLKHIFAAEWGVFAALQFRLHAKPSQVAFHFKRLLKSMEWNPRTYLGLEMFSSWQDALIEEDYSRLEREERRKLREERKERKKLLRMQRELAGANRPEQEDATSFGQQHHDDTLPPSEDEHATKERKERVGILQSPRKIGRIPSRTGIGSIFNRLGGRRVLSSDKLHSEGEASSRMGHSPSMPSFPVMETTESLSLELPLGMEVATGDVHDVDGEEDVEAPILV